MSSLIESINEGLRVLAHRPWPRAIVTPSAWTLLSQQLADGRLTLLGLWGDVDAVHMALLDERPFAIAVVTLACRDGRFPSVGALHPPAIRLERAMRDLYGLQPEDLPDQRPWLDHGGWVVQHPLAVAPSVLPPPPVPYAFLPVEGESVHQIPVGPVHAGIIEPGHFRFNANGEAVVRLEQRLGYTHKGIESLLAGADLERG
ncbi:MAG TPA: NADH-quinone oxidoreductase subunit C, partial [Reyranella sp.]|nr:NADH-quinone oxidoreductase subunit C [Reyranella sp.]